jgi:hypothetical protein
MFGRRLPVAAAVQAMARSRTDSCVARRAHREAFGTPLPATEKDRVRWSRIGILVELARQLGFAFIEVRRQEQADKRAKTDAKAASGCISA